MISLIATVLNEGESIHRLMRSLVAQTRLPDEIVIVDGGSRDNTVALIQTYADRLPLRVVVEQGANISQGRNRAIAAAQGDIIAVTDAGVELAPDWLEKITRPLVENASCEVVCGFFDPQYTNLFELAMSATVLPLKDEINPATFLPSSRSIAFRKAVWQAVGGYPEWLDYCEDLVFDLRAKQYLAQQSAVPFAFVPDALVAFRPRGSLRSFYKQYYLYARGDGKADLWRKRHAARYLTYLVALPAILWLGAVVHPLLWLLLLAGGYVYLRQPYQRLRKLVVSGINPTRLQVGARLIPPAVSRVLPKLGELAYLALMVLVIRVVGDVAKMLGYPVGWLWRLRNHPPNWKVVTISP